MTLLIIAAILWKIKQKYELYLRRQVKNYNGMHILVNLTFCIKLQQLFVELEQMASRPFAGVVVQMNKNNTIVNNPSPIALEPCSNGKAAVLTLLIKLPTGDQSIPQSG